MQLFQNFQNTPQPSIFFINVAIQKLSIYGTEFYGLLQITIFNYNTHELL